VPLLALAMKGPIEQVAKSAEFAPAFGCLPRAKLRESGQARRAQSCLRIGQRSDGCKELASGSFTASEVTSIAKTAYASAAA